MKIDIYNTNKKYNIIYADPPWRYRDKKCNGNCEEHYRTMSLDELKMLPIKNITDTNCVLFMWVTYPQMETALDLIKSWGFTYKTIGFQWIKLNKKANLNTFKFTNLEFELNKSCFFGLGRWTRGNTECCLISIKGKPKRISNNISQLVFDRLQEHSKKPDEVRKRIVDLLGDLPRIELFARQYVDGWDCWGNEV